MMPEAVMKTFSNLVPLLVLLLVVFGGLIILILVLRSRHRRSGGLPPVKHTASPIEMKTGDVGIVLGRTFQVTATARLDPPEGPTLWCCLRREDGDTRLWLRQDLSLAAYFPGCAEAPRGDSFPEQIDREDATFRRIHQPLQLAADWRLGIYQGPADRFLAIEVRGEESTLWRGKSVPAEGVSILQDSETAPGSSTS